MICVKAGLARLGDPKTHVVKRSERFNLTSKAVDKVVTQVYRSNYLDLAVQDLRVQMPEDTYVACPIAPGFGHTAPNLHVKPQSKAERMTGVQAPR